MKTTANTKPPKNFTNKPLPKKKDANAVVEKEPDLSTLNQWFEFSMSAARKRHWDMFVIDQFIDGRHDIKGNAQDNSLVITKNTGRVNFPINKVKATFRAVRGFVTRHYPKVEVLPADSSEEAKAYARRANKTLERDNRLNNFRKINKEWVYYGVKYGVGYRQIGYDPDKKVAMRWTVDPFDLLIGSKTARLEEAPYIIKTVVRTVDYVKNKFGDSTEISADNEIAASEFKRLSKELEFNNSKTDDQTSGNQTLILKECWYRLFEPNKLGGLINKVVFTENMILKTEETPFTEYPFVPYYASIEPDKMNPEGHIKDIISPQRMLNMLNTQLLEYNHLVNRGRFRTEKGSGFKIINTREGQIITTNVGKTVQVLDPPRLSPMLSDQINFALKMIEDLGGQSDAIRGVAPYAGASGDAIEKLQVAGTNDIADLRDNFEDALAQEAAWILKMYSMFESDGVTVYDDKKEETFLAVGKIAREQIGKPVKNKQFIEDSGNYNDVVAILPDNNVKVNVTSELGETKAARQALLFKLLDAGLPLKIILDHLEFPNSDDILQRVAEEAVGDMVMSQLGSNQTPPQIPQGMAPVPEQGGNVEEELANKLKSILGNQ